jgi:hypothetical protein
MCILGAILEAIGSGHKCTFIFICILGNRTTHNHQNRYRCNRCDPFFGSSSSSRSSIIIILLLLFFLLVLLFLILILRRR